MNRCAFLFSVASLAVGSLFSGSAEAATVNAFWSFDTLQNGTGAVNSAVTAENFPGVPSRTRTGSATSSDGGEGGPFIDFQGNAWAGSGSFSTPGHSLAWDGGSTGNSMTHTFSMAGLVDLNIRMGIRSATSTATAPIQAFSAIQYSLDGGVNFFTAASGAALAIPVGGVNFVSYNLDLSSLSAIEQQSNVQLRFSFANVPSTTSFRVDNVVFTAQTVPEPATAALGLLGVAALARRRRLA